LVFVATLIGRPLGALVFGPIADRIGRTKISFVTLAGISLTTYAIAVAPDHTSWGVWTLYWVVAMRFLGGVFLGGQYSAAIPLAMEWAKPERRGFISGSIMAMSPLANATIAALTLGLLAGLGIDEYAAWGWRVPFYISGTLAAAMTVVYVIRVRDAQGSTCVGGSDSLSSPDLPSTAPASGHLTLSSPIKTPQDATTSPKTAALAEVTLGTHRGIFARIFLLMTGLWLLTYMAIPVVTQQLGELEGLNANDVTLIMLCGTGASVVSMAACGHLSTLVGRRQFFVIAGVAIALTAPTCYLLLWQVSSTSAMIACVIGLQVFTVSAYGPIGAYLSERFPAHIRSTGYGLGYSLSIVVPALYPYFLPNLQERFGEHGAVGGLLALGGVCVAVGSALEARVDESFPFRRARTKALASPFVKE
jgi:MFS family permease